jgi:fibronectin-binding autotransporter adhesin
MAAALLAGFGSSAVHAADIERAPGFDGFPTNSTSTWVGGVIPGPTDRVLFTSTSGTLMTVLTPTQFGQMAWTGVMSGATFRPRAAPTSSTLLLSGINGVGIDVQSNFQAQLYNATGITSDQTWRVGNANGGGLFITGIGGWTDLGAHTLTIDLVNATNTAQLGYFKGTGNIVKTGLGTLTVVGTAGFTGSTTVAGGTLALAGAGALANSSVVTVDTGATFDISATDASIKRLAGSGSVALGAHILTLTQANDVFSGVIAGGGGLTIASGQQVLTADNPYTGMTTVASGATLQLGAGNASGSVAGNVANNGVLVFDRSDTLNTASKFSGNGEIRQAGSGIVNLTADSSAYAGSTNVLAGTLQVSGQLGGAANVNGGQLIVDGTLGGAANVNAGNLLVNGTVAGNANIRGGTATVAGQVNGNANVSGGQLQVPGTIAGSATVSGGQMTVDGKVGGDVGVSAGALVVNGAVIGSANVSGGTTTLAGQLGGDAHVTGGQFLLAGNIAGAADIGPGGTLQVIDGGPAAIAGNVTDNGVLAFNRSDAYTFGNTISGAGIVQQMGAGKTILSGNSSAFTGTTNIGNGTLAVNGALAGTTNVLAAGRLQGSGTVGNVSNAGTLAPGNSIGTLTVAGNYAGAGGTLEMEAVLGGDASPADKLVVAGATSGTTSVRVINQGGLGAQTVQGIKLIDVGGASNGTFTLQGDYALKGQPAIIAGAYAYTLQKNGVSTPADGDWYLRSSLTQPQDAAGGAVAGGAVAGGAVAATAAPAGPLYQPGVPLYEAYPSVLLGLTSLPTLQQRVGERAGEGADDGAGNASGPRNGAWARVQGLHNQYQPDHSSTGQQTDTDQFQMQVGVDRQVMQNANGRLVAGVTGQYGYASAGVDSFYGNGRIQTSGYGVGTTLTWYADNGFYVDGQAQVNWFDSKLKSGTLGQSMANNNDGTGYAFGLETGKRLGMGNGWSLTPQAQLTYSSVDFDHFTDPYGARVSAGSSDSLQGRLGLAANYENVARDSAGIVQHRSNVYGIANLYYEFFDGTDVKVAGTRITASDTRAAAGVGFGGTYSWGKDRYSVYGEALVKTTLANFGDSYSYTGTVGFRYRF